MKSHPNAEIHGKYNTVGSSGEEEILAPKAELCLVDTVVAMMWPAKHKSKKTNDNNKKGLCAGEGLPEG